MSTSSKRKEVCDCNDCNGASVPISTAKRHRIEKKFQESRVIPDGNSFYNNIYCY